MSGHSKWHSIRHKKAVKDARRGKLFTKLIKELTVAARMGGGDPEGNPRLRAAVAAARANSMPVDNIDRAIKKGSGELEGVNYEDVSYEGYGPGGMAVLIECVTDNRNRTVAEVRHLFDKHGGNLGENGCVAWMFDRVGQIRVAGADEESVFTAAADAGASDVQDEGGVCVVTTAPEDLERVRVRLDLEGMSIDSAEIVLEPKSTVELSGGDAGRALKLIDLLDDHEDVQRVSANFDIDDEELAGLSA
ncbi:MAG: YebC/PmpR family DNA-binding transcriptional regulator [Deltaproteobacteria bacterium]